MMVKKGADNISKRVKENKLKSEVDNNLLIVAEELNTQSSGSTGGGGNDGS